VATENPARTIYSAEDRDVLPPVLLRPQIASEARIDTEPSNAEIELVVNAEGIVTQVRLRTNGELSLNDRMLVAAAKAWQFRPATKDGRPVSYTLRIPVTP
jgi:protein TonB